jgi:hypothetical protein
MAARANALDDFLPEVASLAEVQRVVLLRFHRQRGVKYVFSVSRPQVFDTNHARRFRISGNCSGRFQSPN